MQLETDSSPSQTQLALPTTCTDAAGKVITVTASADLCLQCRLYTIITNLPSAIPTGKQSRLDKTTNFIISLFH